MKTRIVIVDDHVLIAKAIESMIEGFEGFEVDFVCENGLELQKLINKKSPPKIVLLDISMPVMNGFETALWLKETYPDVLIMALSMQDDEQSLIKMIRNGAKGYMLKNIHPNELENALTKLKEEGSFFPNWATSIVMTSISDNTINADSKSNWEDLLRFLREDRVEPSDECDAGVSCAGDLQELVRRFRPRARPQPRHPPHHRRPLPRQLRRGWFARGVEEWSAW